MATLDRFDSGESNLVQQERFWKGLMEENLLKSLKEYIEIRDSRPEDRLSELRALSELKSTYYEYLTDTCNKRIPKGQNIQ